jgi:class 3 adenylate cyclase
METRTEHGYLVLADISGYTSYLAGVELEHAQDILRDLLEVIVEQFQPVLTLSKLEGDAVFASAPDTHLPRGECMFEILESTYAAFRDRVAACVRRTICQCAACRAIPSLDLKFIVHYGAYVAQRVAGGVELVGSDVNLVHRLLKNSVSEATGWRAYALFTEAALQRLGIRPDGMQQQTETHEHLGVVVTSSLDMQPRYQQLTDARRVTLAPEVAYVVITQMVAAPPPVVWTWLNDPQKRNLYQPGVTWSAEDRPGGRSGPGARNHCAHGKGVLVETVLDWRPFEYCTVEAVAGRMTMLETDRFFPTADGSTRLEVSLQVRVPGPQLVSRFMTRMMARKEVQPALATMARLIEDERAEETDTATATAPA